MTVLQTLTREAAGALGLAEAHVRIAPSRHFPKGLAVSSLSPEALPITHTGEDAPSRLLSRLLAGEQCEAALGPDAEGTSWSAFAISDTHGPLGALAVRVAAQTSAAASADPLDAGARALLARMADQAGLALENSALFGDSVRRAWEVAGIAEAAGATAGEVDVPRLLGLAVQQETTITGAATGAVVLADKRRAVETEQLHRGVLALVDELHRRTTASEVLELGCRTAVELLGVHAALACRAAGSRAAPEMVHCCAAPREGACACSLPDSPGQGGCPHDGTYGECLAAATLREGTPRFLNSSGAGMLCPVLRGLGARAVASVPLPAQGGPITAVLLADTEDAEHFNEEVLGRAALVCSHLGGALEMVQALESQRQEAEISNALLSIAHLVATARDAASILHAMDEMTPSVLSSGTAVTLLWDGTAFAIASLDPEGACAEHPRYRLLALPGGQDLAAALLDSRDPLWIDDLAASSLVTAQLAGSLGSGSALVCPMLSRQEELLGAVVLRPTVPDRRCAPRDAAVALGIAHLGALAIGQARFQQEAVRAERMQALGEMSAGVAHDLNNLLAGIMGNAQLALMNPEDGGAAAAALQTISRACTDGAEIVRRIHALIGRQREGHSDLVDMADVIRRSVQATRPQWHGRPAASGSPLQVMLDLEADVYARGTAPDLEEAISHLITNALDAMPDGGRLTLRCAPQGSWAVVEVVDTGIGMGDGIRQRVFDPFFTTKAQRGHGLGLSLTYGIVQRHLGSITLESAEGKGTAFIVRLPLASAGARPVPVEGPAPLPPLRVLVVDDQPAIRVIVRDTLALAGHTVECFADAVAALDRFRAWRPDVVITDFRLDGMLGTELARAVKQEAATTAVILITGWRPPAADLEGIDCCVEKPFNVQDLLAVVEQVGKQRS